jgi:hypothetical protein
LFGALKGAVTRRKNKVKSGFIRSAGACYMGGICPVISYCVAHEQAPNLVDGSQWTPQAALWLVVVGLLVYSAPLVVQWFSRWVGTLKSVGFVVGLEVAQTFTDPTTALPALVTMVALNAIILRDKFAND